MIQLVKPTYEHAMFIARTMRDEDLVEVTASGSNPVSAMMSGYRSEFALSVLSEGDIPLCMLGVNPLCKLTGAGVPWLLSSKYALQYKREFLEQSPPIIEEMLSVYPKLENYVHVKNRLSIRWLSWLGFYVDKSQPVIMPSGETFYKFTMETDNV